MNPSPDKTIYFEVFASDDMTSSQDPGYVPTQYTYDTELPLNTTVAPLVNSNAPHQHTNVSWHGPGQDVPFPPPSEPEGGLSAIDNAPAVQSSYVQEGFPTKVDDNRNISPPGQRPDTPSTGSWRSSLIQRELSDINEHTSGSPAAAYNSAFGTAPVANAWSLQFPTKSGSKRSNHAIGETIPAFSDTLANGAGAAVLQSPVEANEEEFNQRVRHAECSLTPKQKSKIAKAEAKDNQRLSKIIREEAKVEKKALELAISELADMQRLQKQAVKDEAKVHANHAKVVAAFKKQEVVYLAAKTRYETLLGQLNAEAERLEAVRASGKEATENVTEKAQEVDNLRRMFSIDEREREAKLGQLKERRKSSLWGN